MISAKPEATFTAVLTDAETGLTGTLGVRIENGDGTTHTARTTAGIVEVEAGSGIYSKDDLVAPATRGTYIVLWDDGDALFGAEELRVTHGSPVVEEGDDFVSVDELAAYLSPRAPRDLTDDVLANLAVVSACAQLRTLTGQELDLVEGDTAKFRIGSDDFVYEVLLPEMPVAAVDEVRVDDEVSLDWRLDSGGMVRSTDGAFTRDVYVEVDYSHGYANIPPELRMLALTLAARVYQQGISRQESTGSSSVTFSTSSSLDLTSGEKAIVAKYRMRRASTVEGVPA